MCTSSIEISYVAKLLDAGVRCGYCYIAGTRMQMHVQSKSGHDA